MPPGEQVAIVGIGCRLPGGVDGPAALWQLLSDGVDAIGAIPADRFDAAALYDPQPGTPGRIASACGGMVAGVDLLDADFFGIAPREATRLDPQQRLLLETTCEALDDAGVRRHELAGTATGVFVGAWIGDLEDRLFADPGGVDFHMTTGTGRYALSGRLSYFLDTFGPSLTLDTACSSSLVAVHLAVQSLRAGECDLALAGGANVILEPSITIAYSQMRMIAPDGRCKFGDESADGYVRSDGAAMVALKRLSDAVGAGDRIHAVIRGSAVTNDGRSGGTFVRPGQAGHEAMLRRAYASAGVDPGAVQYVEAHGTGTAAGDTVELGALGAVVGAGRPPGQPCLVGSLKSNIGHTEGAAGVAGLIKATLALAHGEIPASLHVRRRNPAVAWDDIGLDICTAHRPWPHTDGPRVAGVSAFGISGTNAHVVLESAPVASPASPAVGGAVGAQLLAVSAHDDDALRALAGRYRTVLAAPGVALADVCAAAPLHRTPSGHRLTVVAAHADAAVDALTAVAAGSTHPAATLGRVLADATRVVFVFPGQGSQWVGMARDLLADDVDFAAAMAPVALAIEAEAGWSPVAVLTGGAGAERLGDIDVVQPLLFAVQVALAATWRAWGVEPVAVIGHSMGEIAAAHVAGALTLDDAVAVICRRSALLRRIAGAGAMAVVDLPADGVETAIAGHGGVAVAVVNSPRSTVIAGDAMAIDALIARFTADDVFCRRVNVDVASHSPQVDPLLDDLRAALAGITARPPIVAMDSTVDGALVSGATLDASYWTRNLRQPVRFGDAVARQVAAGATAFVEISPHPVLLPAIEQVVAAAAGPDRVVRSVPSLRRDEPGRESMLAGLGALWVDGVDVAWPHVVGRPARHVELPMYPWQRQRYWHEPAARRPVPAGDHDLLGRRTALSTSPGTVVWEGEPGVGGSAYLLDHVVRTAAIMPAAAIVTMMQAALVEELGEGAVSLVGLRLVEPLPLDGRAVQVVLEPEGEGSWRCRVLASRPGEDLEPWHLHAEAVAARPAATDAVVEPSLLRDVQARLLGAPDGAGHEQAMRARGLDYGPHFRTVRACQTAGGEVAARLDATGGRDAGERLVRLLDGAFQLAIDTLPASTAGRTFVPVGVDRIDLHRAPAAEVWAHATLVSTAPGWSCDVTLLDASGSPVATVRGLRLQPVGGAGAASELDYEVRWHAAGASGASGASGDTGDVVGSWIVYAADAVGEDVAAGLRAAGRRCTVVTPGSTFRQVGPDRFVVAADSTEDHARVLREVAAGAGTIGLVDAWATAIGSTGDLVGAAGLLAAAGPLAMLQAIGDDVDARLWIVTRGAQAVGPGAVVAGQAVAWGLGRVVASERPALRCTLVDLDLDLDPDLGAGDGGDGLLAELLAGSDRQVAIRGGRRHVARLEHAARPTVAAPRLVAADAYRIAPTTPGALDGVTSVLLARRAPGPGEVEVRIEAAGLNFLDVLKAMGIYPGVAASPELALGAECAGRIVAVGAHVNGWAVGDEVVAITPSYDATSMLASHVTLPAALVVRRPPHLDAVAASGLPVAYVTALYALRELAHVQPGERVLVHAASGGVGLAAIGVCRFLGAEVIATAGSDAKREFVRTLGVEHVFDSRTTAFADGVMACTGGHGVDVVLNSLTGDAIRAGLAVLAPRGRFVEIGKRDIDAHTRLDLAALRRNVAFFVLDLAALTAEAPAVVAGQLAEVVAMVGDGRLAALPTSVAPLDAAADVFRTMARAEHIGKLVLKVPNGPLDARVGDIRPDRTYVVTGGLGALGRAVAERLVGRGARHVALLGRTDPDAAAAAAITDLRGRGADVRVVRADVTAADSLAGALAEVRRTMPPLAGVVHAAGQLADATIERMDHAQLRRALDPKLAGGWHLHLATAGDHLDHFVLFSSVSGVLGLAGQANYAAGNAFLDALAHERRRTGRPATSIAWGPWAEIGLAASERNRGDRLAARGLGGLSTDEALDAFERALHTNAREHVMVMRFDPARWRDAEPTSESFLAELTDAGIAEVEGLPVLVDRAAAEPPGRRRLSVVEDAICTELAAVLRVVAGRIDRAQTLQAMGLDSLMALELRNRLEVATGLALPATMAFNHSTVAALAGYIAGRLGLSLDADGAPQHTSTAAVEQIPADASGVEEADDGSCDVASDDDSSDDDSSDDFASGDDLEALLRDELSAVERLLRTDGRSS